MQASNNWPPTWTALASLVLIHATSCTLFLPAHSNSDKRDGESVEIDVLTFAEVYGNPELKKDYEKAIPPEFITENPSIMADPLTGSAVAAAAIGFAVDFVAKELEEESTRYEAQFSAKTLRGGFWKKNAMDQYEQRYAAIRLVRKIEGNEVFRVVIGLYPTKVDQLFVVAPLQFQTQKAKAKVLSDELWWWFLPTTWLGKALQHDEHEINSKVGVEITGYWRSADEKLHITKLAGFSLDFNGYDLNESRLWRASTPHLKFPKGPQAFFLSAPLSRDNKGKVVGLGAFTAEIIVTERDKSNAKERLKKLSELVAEQKEKILEKVKDGGN